MENIFSFSDYKVYLKYRTKLEKRIRGNQKALCEAGGLQPSFLSRVVHESLHLTPEHAVGMARFWGLNTGESQYFLELVNMARAGTPLLRKAIQERLQELKERGTQVTERLTLPSLSEEKVQAFYYSSWLISAIHVLISIEGFQTTDVIANRFSVSGDTVERILSQLREFGLIDYKNKKWQVGHSFIHLPRHSPFQGLHQSNWKSQAILDVYRNTSSLHYCNVHSISNADFFQIKEELVSLISKTTKTIQESPAQRLGCINIDYFEL